MMNIGKLKKTGVVLLAIGMLGLTACGDAMPELTEEQHAKVVEYASGLLLKYDKNYKSRLVEEEVPLETLEQEEDKATTQSDTTASESPTMSTETGEVEAEKENVSMEQLLGLENITIHYVGYDLKEKYPDAGEAELSMAMNATPNYELFILKFEVTNLTETDVLIDMIAANAKFKISLNGEASKRALTTMLLDDLSSYKGTIVSNETVPLVLVIEIPEGNVEGIENIHLSVEKEGVNTNIILQ